MNSQQEQAKRNKWVREREAAKYLGLSKSFLAKDRWSKHLGIPYVRLGRTILYDLDALDLWMARKAEESR